jgi:nicotinate-nucleotide pyrophosphorylase
MKIFGHKWIPSVSFYKINILEDIQRTPPNGILLFNSLKEDIEYIDYCLKNALLLAIEVEDITEAIFANALGIKYIFIESHNAKEIMSIAQHYLFDTQILVKIISIEEIESLAKIGVDGVVFSEAIKH